MCREIAAIDMLDCGGPPAPSVLLLTEPKEKAALVDEFERRLSGLSPRPALLRKAIAGGEFWRKLEDKRGPVIPTHALDEIVESFCKVS
jgi:hypothetical protein